MGCCDSVANLVHESCPGAAPRAQGLNNDGYEFVSGGEVYVFRSLLDSASAATAPDSKADLWMYEGARVSGQVASQSRHLLLTQGTRVAPSGRLASVRVRPGSSRMAGTLAICSARRIVSFDPQVMAEVATGAALAG